jgi:hypothetical protein
MVERTGIYSPAYRKRGIPVKASVIAPAYLDLVGIGIAADEICPSGI